MFQFIRKHQAIGLIFIGIVIVSFVIFFSPNGSSGGGGIQSGAIGTIRGKPIDRETYIGAIREARLAYWLREGGNWPGRGGRDWDQDQQVLNRLFLLEEAKRLGVGVSDEVVARRIVDLPMFRDERTGGFSRATYDQFLALIERDEGMTRADFERFMRHEVALGHLVQITGMSGSLVPPREAEARYRANNDQFGGLLVAFSASNHLARVDLSPPAVGQYYSNHLAEYRIPERVVVRYVLFAATNFSAEAEAEIGAVTNLDLTLETQYQSQGPESFRNEQGEVMTPEQAKAEIRDQFKKRLELQSARKKAIEFANRLYQMEPNVESLSKLGAETGLNVLVSPAFDQFRPPAGMNVPTTFNRAAFQLSETEPFATPVTSEDGVYVFAFDRRVPPEFPPLALVQDRVIASMRMTESRALAEAEGRQFAALATNALATGKTFEAIAAEANLKVVALTNFSRSTRSLMELGSRLTVSEVLRVAEEMKVGEVSRFTPGADGGFLLYLTDRRPVPAEELKEALPEFTKQLQQFGRFSAFSEWERRQFAEAEVRGPGSRDTNAPPPLPQP